MRGNVFNKRSRDKVASSRKIISRTNEPKTVVSRATTSSNNARIQSTRSPASRQQITRRTSSKPRNSQVSKYIKPKSKPKKIIQGSKTINAAGLVVAKPKTEVTRIRSNSNIPVNRKDESFMERMGRFADNTGKGAEGTIRSYTTDIVDTAGSLITGSDSEVMNRRIQDMTLVDAYVTSAIAGNLDPAFAETKRRATDEPGRIVGEVGAEVGTLFATMGVGAALKGVKVAAISGKVLANSGKASNTALSAGKIITKRGIKNQHVSTLYLPDSMISRTTKTAGEASSKTVLKKMGIFDKIEKTTFDTSKKLASWTPKNSYISKVSSKVGGKVTGFYGIGTVDATRTSALSKKEIASGVTSIPAKEMQTYMKKGVKYFVEPSSDNIIDMGSKSSGNAIQDVAGGYGIIDPKVMARYTLSKTGSESGRNLKRTTSASLTSGVDININDVTGYTQRAVYAMGQSATINPNRIKNMGGVTTKNKSKEYYKYKVSNPRGTDSMTVVASSPQEASKIVVQKDSSYVASVMGFNSIDDDVKVTRKALMGMKDLTMQSRIRDVSKHKSTISQAKKLGITPMERATQKVDKEKFISEGQTLGGGDSQMINREVLNPINVFTQRSGSRWFRRNNPADSLPNKSKARSTEMASGLGTTGFKGDTGAVFGDSVSIPGLDGFKSFIKKIDTKTMKPHREFDGIDSKGKRKAGEVDSWKARREDVIGKIDPDTGKPITSDDLKDVWNMNPNVKSNRMNAQEYGNITYKHRWAKGDVAGKKAGQEAITMEMYDILKGKKAGDRAAWESAQNVDPSALRVDFKLRDSKFYKSASNKLSNIRSAVYRTPAETSKVAKTRKVKIQKQIASNKARKEISAEVIADNPGKSYTAKELLKEVKSVMEEKKIPFVNTQAYESDAKIMYTKKRLDDIVEIASENNPGYKPNSLYDNRMNIQLGMDSNLGETILRKGSGKPDPRGSTNAIRSNAIYQPDPSMGWPGYGKAPSIKSKVKAGRVLSRKQRNNKDYMSLGIFDAPSQTDARGKILGGFAGFGKRPNPNFIVSVQTFKNAKNANKKRNPEVNDIDYYQNYLQKSSPGTTKTKVYSRPQGRRYDFSGISYARSSTNRKSDFNAYTNSPSMPSFNPSWTFGKQIPRSRARYGQTYKK